MDTVTLFRQLAISLLLGLLVGLQRERTDAEIAGFRTFSLITVLGTLCAVMATSFSFPWMLAVGFVGVAALAVIGNMLKLQRSKGGGTGVTTEVAMLLMYGVGAFVVVGPWEIAVAVGAGVAILLQLKPELHGFAARLGERDFRAILQFALITFIVLPVLPNRFYDPLAAAAPVLKPLFPEATLPKLDVLNPYEIWWLVVLVVGISLGGYVAYKLFGAQAGTLLGGVLGGTISSTATTVSYSRRSRGAAEIAGLSAVVVTIATTVSFIRVLLEIAVAGPALFVVALGPLLVLLAAAALLSVVVWFMESRRAKSEMPEHENPTELKSAVVFAALYAGILLAVAAAREFLPPGALYVVAVLSGLTDMDAITLSTSRLAQTGSLDVHTAWRMIVVAGMANLVFKAGIVYFTGHRSLFRRMLWLFGGMFVTGGVLLVVWR